MASIKFVCPACHTEHAFPLIPGMEGGRWITIQCSETRQNINIRIVVQAELTPTFDYKEIVHATDVEYKADERWREEERVREEEQHGKDVSEELLGKDGEKKDERQ